MSHLKVHKRQSQLLGQRYVGLANLHPPDNPPLEELASMVYEIQGCVNEWAALNEVESLANEADIANQLRDFHARLDDYQVQDENALNEARRDDRHELQAMLLRFMVSQSADNLHAAVSAMDEPWKLRRTIREALRSNSLRPEDRTLLETSRNLLQGCRGSVSSASELAARPDLAYIQTNFPGGYNPTGGGINRPEDHQRTNQGFQTNNPHQASLGSGIDARTYVASPATYHAGRIVYDKAGGIKLANLDGLYSHLFANPTDKSFREIFLACHKAIAKTSALLEFFNTQLVQFPGNQTHNIILECLNHLLSVQPLENEPDSVLLKQKARALVDRIAQRNRDHPQTIRSILSRLEGISPTPSIASSGPPSTTFSRAQEVSRFTRQLVNQEVTLFRQITLPDCMEWLNRPDVQEQNTLGQFLRSHHAITDWCQCDILFETKYDDEGSRAQAITFWCEVADVCLEIGAYSTANALLAGLDSPFVQKAALGGSWGEVNSRTEKTFERIKTLLNRGGGCANYKERVEKHQDKSFLPIIGQHLNKVRREYQTTQGNGGEGGERLLDFEALTQAYKGAKELLEFKRTISLFPSDETTLAHVQNTLLKVQLLERLQTRLAEKSEKISKREARRRIQRGRESAGMAIAAPPRRNTEFILRDPLPLTPTSTTRSSYSTRGSQ